MPDREKVVKGYMICVEHGLLTGEDCHGYHQWEDNHYEIEKTNDYSKECPYNGCETGCVKTLAKDALALLKQEVVVRCKDCKWWDKKDDSNYGYCHACKHGYHSDHWEIGIYRTYKGDWFCADGERKEGREVE